MITDPCADRVIDDLQEADFLNGLETGRWRVLCFAFPVLNFVISATEVDGNAAEYGFRAELSNYPAQAPFVQIWDHAANTPLA